MKPILNQILIIMGIVLVGYIIYFNLGLTDALITVIAIATYIPAHEILHYIAGKYIVRLPTSLVTTDNSLMFATNVVFKDDKDFTIKKMLIISQLPVIASVVIPLVVYLATASYKLFIFLLLSFIANNLIDLGLYVYTVLRTKNISEDEDYISTLKHKYAVLEYDFDNEVWLAKYYCNKLENAINYIRKKGGQLFMVDSEDKKEGLKKMNMWIDGIKYIALLPDGRVLSIYSAKDNNGNG